MTGAGYARARVFACACLGMLMFGVVLACLGAILPQVIARFGIGKGEAGSLFSLLSLGILAGSLVFGPLVDRFGYRPVLAACAVLIAAGLEGIAGAGSPAPLRAAVLAIGVGGGAINGATNALVADISEGGRSAGLSLLGVFFGVGALGVPFALGLLAGSAGDRAVIAATGALAVLPLLAFALVRFPPPKQAQGFPLARAAELLHDRRLLLLGAMLFCESGMEITLGGWTAAFFHEELALSAERAVLLLSLYWLAMTVARLILGALLRRARAERVLAGSIAVALAGALTLLASRQVAPAAGGLALLGAGFAAVYPVVLGWVGDLHPALSGTAFSLVLAMALAGGMVLPWLTGVVGEAHGLRASFAIVPAALVALAALFWTASARGATSAAAAH